MLSEAVFPCKQYRAAGRSGLALLVRPEQRLHSLSILEAYPPSHPRSHLRSIQYGLAEMFLEEGVGDLHRCIEPRLAQPIGMRSVPECVQRRFNSQRPQPLLHLGAGCEGAESLLAPGISCC